MSFVLFSNVAYHGDLQKKAVMELKRTLTGENGDAGSGKTQNLMMLEYKILS